MVTFVIFILDGTFIVCYKFATQSIYKPSFGTISSRRSKMAFMVGIDTGGTFTDGFFTRDGDLRTAKVLTTPHDLTVCLADCVREGARQFGV